MASLPPLESLVDLNYAEAIVNPDGTPSDYFMRYLLDRGGFLNNIEKYIAAFASQQIIAGGALSGGGLVFADPPTEIALDPLVPPPTGSYTNSNISVDQYGRVITAANGGSDYTFWQNRIVAMQGEGNSDLGMTGLLDRNQLILAGHKGVVSWTSSNPGISITGGAIEDLFDGTSGYVTFEGCEPADTITVTVAYPAPIDNFARGWWQPFSIYRERPPSSLCVPVGMKVEVSNDGVTWTSGTGTAWQTADWRVKSAGRALWMGKEAMPDNPLPWQYNLRFFRFTFSNFVAGLSPGYEKRFDAVGLGLRALSAPYADQFVDRGKGGEFFGDIKVPAEAYGPAWSGSREVPTKGDLFTKIESMGGGGGGGLVVSNLHRVTGSMTGTGTQFAGSRLIPFEPITITGIGWTALKAASGVQQFILRLVTLSNSSGAGTISSVLASSAPVTVPAGPASVFIGGMAAITPVTITPGAANYGILAESTAADSMRIGLTDANAFFAGLPCLSPAGFAGTVAVAPGASFLNSGSPFTLGLVVQ